jgi:outer membrane protein
LIEIEWYSPHVKSLGLCLGGLPLVLALLSGCAATPGHRRPDGLLVSHPGGPSAQATSVRPAGPNSGAGARDGAVPSGPGLESDRQTVGAVSGYQQADWGIAAVVRTATIPFKSTNESVSSFVPMMFYEGDRVFLRGVSGGFHLWDKDETEFNALARARFFDIPSGIQNEVQGDTVDVGLQVVHGPDHLWVEGEWMSDTRGRQHGNVRIAGYKRSGKLDLIPSLGLRYKTPQFNDHYFALNDVTGDRVGSGWELKPNLVARYHLKSDVYLVGSVGYTFYDQSTRHLDAIDEPGQAEILVGFGFFQHGKERRFLGVSTEREGSGRDISTPAYVRLAHGWATPSDLGDILAGDSESDSFDNQLTSIFYGLPLTDELFGVPLDIYLTPGFVWHHDSRVQSSAQEIVLAIKAYYTINWPTRWRIGFAEGLSWISDITHIEKTSLEEKGYEPSDLMNYLDVSFDVNIGDLFGSERFRPLWLGYSVHHRSSIFESASQFGRIKGGSNYNSVYLQYDFL